MEITTKTIIFAIISVILIAAILGGVFYLLKNSKQLNLNNNQASISKLQVISNNPIPTPTKSNTVINQTQVQAQVQTQVVPPVVLAESTKTYQGQNFVLKYPTNWGILTCNNTKNIEFDPYDKNDLINYSCDNAIKPITIIVSTSPVNCSGETVKIGNNTVIKSKTETAYWFKNRWCLNKNGTYLDITNRIAPAGIKGTGKDDFSTQIEQIISSL